jgi:hypothetical protein
MASLPFGDTGCLSTNYFSPLIFQLEDQGKVSQG